MAIEQLVSGQRVLANNLELDHHTPDAPLDPADHRLLTLRVAKPDGGVLDDLLLRSLDWIDAAGAAASGTITLDLAELSADGPVGKHVSQ